jgi:hypothetical protein
VRTASGMPPMITFIPDHRAGFRWSNKGNNPIVLWIPLVLTIALIVFIVLIFWSAWEPFRDDLKEDPVVMIPIVTLLGATILLPPLAWAVGLAI